jgi:hypothetical protein
MFVIANIRKFEKYDRASYTFLHFLTQLVDSRSCVRPLQNVALMIRYDCNPQTTYISLVEAVICHSFHCVTHCIVGFNAGYIMPV